MSAILQKNGAPQNDAEGTLGALLYADKGRARVPESEWAALVRSIATGDQPALHALYGRAHHIVFTLALRICGNRQTAEELTVDVFHGVWRNAASYDPATGTVLGWIMNHARSRAIDRTRYEHRQKRGGGHAHDSDVEIAVSDTTASDDAAERDQTLRAAVAKLTPHERQAIETAFFSELSYAAVAEKLHEPLGTIKTRIRSGLAKLRQGLDRGAMQS